MRWMSSSPVLFLKKCPRRIFGKFPVSERCLAHPFSALLVPALERLGMQRYQFHEQAIKAGEERFHDPGFIFGLGRKEREDANLFVIQNIYTGEFEVGSLL